MVDRIADAETTRLQQDAERASNWKRWGPYLSERQWGTVREDYSADGDSWSYFPHDHARSRAYRWGEDGLLGISDREGRLCFALALWNGRDPILKERLFGVTGREGNHGEDVKEEYFYLDSSPTHSYLKALYKYPQAAFPYDALVAENRRRGKDQPEYELADTGVFAESRYFDVQAEYAKASPDDVLVRVTVTNRGPEAATVHVLPQLWFRNTWSWNRSGEAYPRRPRIEAVGERAMTAEHATLGRWRLDFEGEGGGDAAPELLFTENETNQQRLYRTPNRQPYVKDAFHEHVVRGVKDAVRSQRFGTKAAVHHVLALAPGESRVLRLRLTAEGEAKAEPFGEGFDTVFAARLAECDAFYAARIPAELGEDERRVARQAYAGLLWSKQFYFYVVKEWLEGDPALPPPPAGRAAGRNRDWTHLYNRDVISMPDKWEYPWYAAWDLAFHMLPFARVDVEFAKQQIVLFTREWYMHPNGQMPAYEWAFDDVNPPVHAWAAWRVYKMSGPKGRRDRLFLERVFQKLVINFTWWVNRKDLDGNHLFAGGFLGLDNVGVFDRSKPLPGGGRLEQADGTAWMAFYCGTMLSIALELASEDPAYEDLASKFFEHFVAIADAMNHFGGTGLWDEQDGFYYDRIHLGGKATPMRLRSAVGLIPLIAVEVLEQDVIERLPGFKKRLQWFVENRSDLASHIAYMDVDGDGRPDGGHRLLAIPSRERLERVLRVLLDEREFLSPHGIRSMSRAHGERPFEFAVDGAVHRVAYSPAESTTELFGGNSNWRGPVWFPLNYLLLEALERYHHFYGDTLKVECPTGSNQWLDLRQVAAELSRRLTALFVAGADGRRAFAGGDERYASDPHWKDLLLFHEYFDGDHGRGAGASHQTGWTALVVQCLEKQARERAGASAGTLHSGGGGSWE
ncbi:MAG: glucosidase [Candidatus Eisenbacteria bacterium]|uniref:Glucosidase n=1 Tax=Eiseniibacteriota bacterium TaxID=2212470 RepID=A0A933W891_UNCEI|nr:glucosidase [Candidatus Eisenbacteria bacterium]